MTIETEFDVYLRARFTLLLLQTAEEERAIQLLKSVCERSGRPLLAWDVAEGFQTLGAAGTPPAARDPISALEYIDKAEDSALFVLKDFHECWANPQIKRKLRSVVQRLTLTRKSIVVTFPGGQLPTELKDAAVLLELPPPSAQQLDQVLKRISEIPGVKQNLTPLGREKLVQAALGLTAAQAQRVFSKAVVTGGVLDETAIALVMGEKKDIIRDSEALEFYAVAETPDDVGGLEVLKNWLRLRERAFTQQARDYG